MPRSVPEWIGKTDDASLPPRVRLRIFDKYKGCCANCGRTIVGKLKAAFDHIIALINGGQNRETNFQLLCHECHGGKTASDIKEKSIHYNKRISGLGLRNKKLMPGSRGSGIRRRMSGEVWREDK